MKTEEVIALDPGERTGYATAGMSRDLLVFRDYGTMQRREMALNLYNWQVRPPGRRFDVIAWEAWVPRRNEAGEMDWIEGDKLLSPRHVGHFELIAWLSGARTKEYGAEKKKHFQKSMAPQLVLLQRGASEQHPKDALMHLWGYFFENWFTANKAPEDCVVLEVR